VEIAPGERKTMGRRKKVEVQVVEEVVVEVSAPERVELDINNPEHGNKTYDELA